jgi:hypothetical protein
MGLFWKESSCIFCFAFVIFRKIRGRICVCLEKRCVKDAKSFGNGDVLLSGTVAPPPLAGNCRAGAMRLIGFWKMFVLAVLEI